MSDIVVDINNEILNELNTATAMILQRYKLGNSDLIKSIDWEYEDDIWVMYTNSYFKFLNEGRRSGAKRIPVYALIKWLKKKNIAPRAGYTYNSLAFAIANSIYKVGIKGKGFSNTIINTSLEIIAEYIAEDLSVQIADTIAEELTITLGNTE